MKIANLTRVLTQAAIVIVTVAAILKLIDLNEFTISLTTWNIIPERIVPMVAFLVPAAELSVAFVWIGMGNLWRAGVLCFCIILAFTMAYVIQWVLGGPPDCSCFGKLLQYENSKESAYMTIVRNIIILAMLMPATRNAARRRQSEAEAI